MMGRPIRLEWRTSLAEKRFSGSKNTFLKIMRTAEQIEKENPNVLADSIRALGRKMQAEFITNGLVYGSYDPLPYDLNEEWFNTICNLRWGLFCKRLGRKGDCSCF